MSAQLEEPEDKAMGCLHSCEDFMAMTGDQSLEGLLGALPKGDDIMAETKVRVNKEYSGNGEVLGAYRLVGVW